MLGQALHAVIHRLGPLGVALGAALEGETAVVIGGTAAREGLFHPVASAAAACAGSFLADQLVFWIARRERQRPWVREHLGSAAGRRALGILERHPRLFCFSFRFIYGFRIAGPAAIGASSVPARMFIVLNAVSAAVWAILFTWLGMRFGMDLLHALSPVLRIPHVALEAAVFVVLAGVAAWWARRR